MAPAHQPHGFTCLVFLASVGFFLFWLWSPLGWIYVGILIASVARAVELRRGMKADRLVIVRPVEWRIRKDTATFPSRGGAA